MDLLLIRSNDVKTVYGGTRKYVACEPPYWAGVIAAYARENGIDAEILDAEAFDYSPEEVADIVKEKNPKLTGVIVTGSNLSASTQKMEGASLICRAIKERNKNLLIFMWGLHPSALPERTLQEEKINFVIKGEGLESVVLLINSLKSAGGGGGFAPY